VEQEELDHNVSQLAESAQALAQHLQEVAKPLGVAFPRRVIRPLHESQQRWPYLRGNVSRTLACAIQLCDINRWQLNTWQIGLTAGTMWEWHCTVPVIAVIEALLIEYGVLNQWLNRDTKFKKAINFLHSRGVYGHDHQAELHWLREYRNELHLFLKGKVQMHDGSPMNYNRAVRALQATEEMLREHWQRQERAA